MKQKTVTRDERSPFFSSVIDIGPYRSLVDANSLYSGSSN